MSGGGGSPGEASDSPLGPATADERETVIGAVRELPGAPLVKTRSRGKPRRAPFEIGGRSVEAGQRATVDIPVSVMADHTPIHLSAHVIHGRREGPTMFVSAAVHGDELVGVEVVRRLLRSPRVARLSGTLIAVPVVNAFGFLAHSRYLPDRRDLNRSFPGSERGSLAGRLAHLFLESIVKRCEVGIDLHTAARHRTNLPQVRVSAGRERMTELAEAFGAPVIITSSLRDGSLRGCADRAGVDVLLYEGGEALRFDETAIRAGVSGCLRVMAKLGMIGTKGVSAPRVAPLHAESSRWLRAPAGGIVRDLAPLGSSIRRGEVAGAVADPFGETRIDIVAEDTGLVIGRSELPVVNEGDALLHVARFGEAAGTAEARVEEHEEQLAADPLFDEDEII